MKPSGSNNERWAKRGGFLVGLAVVAVLVLGWRVPAGTGKLDGADLIFSSARIGELDVSAVGPFLTVTALRPSSPPVRGQVEITNQTGRRLAVRVRARADARDLDRLLLAQLSMGKVSIFRGRLGDLRAWTAQPFFLDSGARGTLVLRVWFPSSLRSGYKGRIESVPV